MSDSASRTAAALREAFDRAFAEAPAAAGAATEDVLAVRIGGDPYAVRVAEIVALHADRDVVAIPSDAAELRGLAGVRGGLVPVFDLAMLLGYRRPSSARWLLVARAGDALALAFETLERHERVDRQALASVDADAGSRPFVRGALRAAGAVRPVVHVAGVVEALVRRADAPKGG